MAMERGGSTSAQFPPSLARGSVGLNSCHRGNWPALRRLDDPPVIFSTPRLLVRELVDADAAFLVELLNDRAFVAHIGDRGVRDEAGAKRYLESGPRTSYRVHGFGLWCVVLHATQQPVGICGLLQRAELLAPDLGYAFLEGHRGQGLAREAAAATAAFARDTLGIERLLAIVSPGNAASIRLLEHLGFRREGIAPLAIAEPPLLLYGRSA
jgi:ribosomal-protein-alanine N-acetyltransferase